MRFIIGLLLTVFVLAVFRALLHEIQSAVGKALRGEDAEDAGRAKKGSGKTSAKARTGGHLVKDPVSGVYVDEATAVRAEVNGQTYFFESPKTRDAFLKRQTA